MTSNQTPHVLDNPIWNSLSTNHIRFAIGTHRAMRYPPDMSIIAATADRSEIALNELKAIVAPGEVIVIGDFKPADVPDWTVLDEFVGRQMTCEQPLVEEPFSEPIVDLTAADVPEILALIDLTHPGPFGQRTIELGRYFGIRKDGRLAAMAGERFHPPGYHEVSAVCTHPDYQGRGYAAALIRRVVVRQQQDGDIPFLAVSDHNDRAIALYERLNFRTRRLVSGIIIRR